MSDKLKDKKYLFISLIAIAIVAILSMGGYYYYKLNIANGTEKDNTARDDNKVDSVDRQSTTKTTVVESTSTPSVTESPVPAGLKGPSGTPVINK